MAKSIEEQLREYMKSNSFKSRVNNGELKGMVALKSEVEVKRLKDFIQEELDNCYASYTPRIYKRTQQLGSSLRLDLNGEIFEITFDDSYSFKPSFINDGDFGYTPLLMNYGWHWGKPHKYIERFTDYNGFHFVENGIQRYLKDAPKGIAIKIYRIADGLNEIVEFKS